MVDASYVEMRRKQLERAIKDAEENMEKAQLDISLAKQLGSDTSQQEARMQILEQELNRARAALTYLGSM